MRRTRIGQARRVASILLRLITEGAKSFPELKKPFPNVSDSAINRDLKILCDVGLVVKKTEPRFVNGKTTRKVFLFFMNNKDVKGRTLTTMQNLKNCGYQQVTLDMIASHAGFPPRELEEIAYALAPKVGLLIGSECVEAPPEPLKVGWSTSPDK